MIYFNPRFPDLIYMLSDTENSMWITIGLYKYATRYGYHVFKLKDSEGFIKANKFIPYRLSHLIENFNNTDNNNAWKTKINDVLEYLSRG